ncbi:MAG: hypothetical protein CM15mP74_05410 [Halieaceae bacterium]|nr:MAG: hypothetical protein CM15mP74_05410 [Halieaceae bacterium]
MNTATQLFDDAEKGSSLWHDAWLRLRKNKLALFGGSVLLFMMSLRCSRRGSLPTATRQNLDLGASPPSAAHWLGTDIFGRDVLTQSCTGSYFARRGLHCHRGALLIGVTWGAVAGYVGGRVDAVMMRLVDILYALPFMIFIVLLMVVFGRNICSCFWPLARWNGSPWPGSCAPRCNRYGSRSLSRRRCFVGLSRGDYP